tara:strand:- start:320 stop:511 length:192 start_codon:yes stop_codon:yes gene_type:complete
MTHGCGVVKTIGLNAPGGWLARKLHRLRLQENTPLIERNRGDSPRMLASAGQAATTNGWQGTR